jgi:hypothetical protein
MKKCCILYNYTSYITYKLEWFCAATKPLFLVPLFVTTIGDDLMCFHPSMQFQKNPILVSIGMLES